MRFPVTLLWVVASASAGCRYEGQEYREGEVVQVPGEPCLNCRCHEGSLLCRLRMCPPLPDTPPPGCVQVHRKLNCCPQFDCSQGCMVGGKHYTEGEMVQSAAQSKCESCFCLKGKLRCATITCSSPAPGCKPIFTPGQCCPSRYNCSRMHDAHKKEDALGLQVKNSVLLKQKDASMVRSMTGMELSSNPSTITEPTMSTEATTLTETTTTDDEDSFTSTVTTTEITTEGETTLATTTNVDIIMSTETTLLPATTVLQEHDYATSVEDNVTVSSPERAIPPEIEAILNITHKKDDDYEYDYSEQSLPPSLPNLRIIPFVAADAVVEDEEDAIDASVQKHRGTENPLFYKGSQPNRFSPPIETEGGFVPREPLLDGPFYEVPYHTTVLNIPDSDGTIIPPSITMLPKSEGEVCLSDGREYHHGEVISEPSTCVMCICYYGEVLCQESKCPHVKTGCRRLNEKDVGVCCGRVICDEAESPTVVLDVITTPSSQHPGGVVPPITVATGVVTPDPFRDVIRTEPAPDLPSLIGDMMPFLIEHHKPANNSSDATVATTITPSTATKTANKPDDDDESTFSLDNLLQLFFSVEELAPNTTVSTSFAQPSTSEGVLQSNVTVNGGSSVDPFISNSHEPPPGRPPNGSSNSSILKLAGCNIYGRMYRVGRIISELSGPCLECMCTEVGVQCHPLPC